ncbi:hypothetical protein JTE90_021950 [Oedothorax gibbosus]|uniref:Uncharacterized protein n=1 Tax=Oedothorax gibbosus TaxID=931172 RepID=A0AAV6V5J9_9ARAC|nr:hypothetical protein JTE90_021950 [Oedothorax gibbosus]
MCSCPTYSINLSLQIPNQCTQLNAIKHSLPPCRDLLSFFESGGHPFHPFHRSMKSDFAFETENGARVLTENFPSTIPPLPRFPLLSSRIIKNKCRHKTRSRTESGIRKPKRSWKRRKREKRNDGTRCARVRVSVTSPCSESAPAGRPLAETIGRGPARRSFLFQNKRPADDATLDLGPAASPHARCTVVVEKLYSWTVFCIGVRVVVVIDICSTWRPDCC